MVSSRKDLKLLRNPSCDSQNLFRLGAAINFDRYANENSLPPPPAAARRRSPARACRGQILSNKKETVTKTVTVSFWQQTQFSIRVALGCKVALKCNPKSICNRPTNWNLYNSHFLPITAIPFFIEAEIRLTTTAATTTIITIKIRFSAKTSVRFINEKGPRITN